MLEQAREKLVELNILGDSKKKGPTDSLKTQSRQKNVDIPKTLGDLPAAEEFDGSEFAYLDKLDGEDLVEALAKMPKDKADRYLTL